MKRKWRFRTVIHVATSVIIGYGNTLVPLVPGSVAVARQPLELKTLVRIQAGQPNVQGRHPMATIKLPILLTTVRMAISSPKFHLSRVASLRAKRERKPWRTFGRQSSCASKAENMKDGISP